MKSSVSAQEALLQQQHLDLGAYIQDKQNELTRQCSNIIDSVDGVVDDIRQINQVAETLISEELQKDIPTGKSCFSFCGASGLRIQSPQLTYCDVAHLTDVLVAMLVDFCIRLPVAGGVPK